MRLRTVVLLLSVCTITSANASVKVFANGLAHDCYVAAEHGSGDRNSEDACTFALADDSLLPRDRAATYINRGVVYTGMHNLDAALADYDKAVVLGSYLDPTDLGVAYVDRAFVLNAKGRFSEALESANKGLSLGTARPEVAYYIRAAAEESLGNIKGAYLDYKQALALLPTFTPAAEQLKRFHVVVKPAEGG
jgi:tetratricopeptide (TPR) repeat protein